jgi:hypothetical protein
MICDGVAVRRRLAVIADALELDAGEIDRALATRAGSFCSFGSTGSRLITSCAAMSGG